MRDTEKQQDIYSWDEGMIEAAGMLLCVIVACALLLGGIIELGHDLINWKREHGNVIKN